MIESEEIEEIDPGIVDPRMAAEAVSLDIFAVYPQRTQAKSPN